jgi:hypothetical protein
MNRNARAIIAEFRSKNNQDHLGNTLVNLFNDTLVQKYVNEHLEDLINHKIQSMEQDMYTSDLMPGISIRDQIECYNHEFIQDRAAFIKIHVLKGTEIVPKYMVKDDLPTSRFGLQHHRKSGNDILKTWEHNPTRSVQAREDVSGDTHPNNTFYGQGDRHMQTGIVFCDQSDINTSNHVSQFQTANMMALNQTDQPHTQSSFGNPTAASDARLLARRVFRSNETGVENGIPVYEQRLQRRNLDRDVTEGTQGRERECIVLGHDMESLHRRIEHKNRAHAKFGSPDPRKLRLQNNSAHTEEMNYC